LAPTCWKVLRKGFEQDPQFDRESGQILIFEKNLSGEMNNLKRVLIFIYHKEIQMLLTYLDQNIEHLNMKKRAVQEFDRDYNGCKDLKTFDKD
jgi:hypothetical protein